MTKIGNISFLNVGRPYYPFRFKTLEHSDLVFVSISYFVLRIYGILKFLKWKEIIVDYSIILIKAAIEGRYYAISRL
jgi:hypothetical protein